MATNQDPDFFNEIIRKVAENSFQAIEAFVQRYPTPPGKTDRPMRMTKVDIQRLMGRK